MDTNFCKRNIVSKTHYQKTHATAYMYIITTELLLRKYYITVVKQALLACLICTPLETLINKLYKHIAVHYIYLLFSFINAVSFQVSGSYRRSMHIINKYVATAIASYMATI